MYCAAAPSYHDFLRHLFADGNARLLDVDYNISAQGVDYLYSAADDKSEIFEMLFYFRLPPIFLMIFSSPTCASIKGIILSPSSSFVFPGLAYANLGALKLISVS